MCGLLRYPTMCQRKCRRIPQFGVNHRKEYLHGRPLSTPAEATILMKDLQTIFSRRGFNLTKLIFNSEDFLRTIDKNDTGNSDSLTSVERRPERGLGVKWKPDKDVLLVEATKFQTIDYPTQRKLLKFVSSNFDYLGITMPLTIRLRK